MIQVDSCILSFIRYMYIDMFSYKKNVEYGNTNRNNMTQLCTYLCNLYPVNKSSSLQGMKL